MTPDAPRSRSWRRVRDVTFALCTLWLFVQNTAWLALHAPWRRLPGWGAIETLVRAAWETMRPLLAVALAVLLGCLVALALARSAARGAAAQEQNHG